jgi:hypothetical protein
LLVKEIEKVSCLKTICIYVCVISFSFVLVLLLFSFVALELDRGKKGGKKGKSNVCVCGGTVVNETVRLPTMAQ